MDARMRALLEELAFGDGDDVRPADRLRAAEVLAAADGDDSRVALVPLLAAPFFPLLDDLGRWHDGLPLGRAAVLGLGDADPTPLCPQLHLMRRTALGSAIHGGLMARKRCVDACRKAAPD